MTQTIIDEDKLHEFMGKVLNDFGAALSSTLVYIGQKLGLYHAMAGAGWLTASEEVLRACLAEAGFTQFRRATETPFNRIFEAQP